MVVVDADAFPGRLARAGFDQVKVNAVPGAFRFRAQKASLEI
jgi:hypothetical protein